ncbi:MAG: hypothetical protein KA105_03155 [Caulobacter sp.]|nr:hypothetical protein [Caulobacter sp.]
MAFEYHNAADAVGLFRQHQRLSLLGKRRGSPVFAKERRDLRAARAVEGLGVSPVVDM